LALTYLSDARWNAAITTLLDQGKPALARQLPKRALEIDQKAEAVHWRMIRISAPDPQGPATSK
jgi:hypothetical protein